MILLMLVRLVVFLFVLTHYKTHIYITNQFFYVMSVRQSFFQPNNVRELPLKLSNNLFNVQIAYLF